MIGFAYALPIVWGTGHSSILRNMDRPPKDKSAGDIAHYIAKAVVSAIPTAGGPLQVLLETIFSAPLEKRKLAWLEELADVVTELQQKVAGLTPEKLAANEAFITVALQASQIAIRNHHKDKLDALRNAVLNSALPNPPEEDEQLIFLRLIDQLIPWHLRFLALLDSPEGWMTRHDIQNPGWSMGGVSTVIEHCFPDLKGKRDIYDQIVLDLQADGLIQQGQFVHVTMSGQGMMASRTTNRGKRFLKFISAPGQ